MKEFKVVSGSANLGEGREVEGAAGPGTPPMLDDVEKFVAKASRRRKSGSDEESDSDSESSRSENSDEEDSD